MANPKDTNLEDFRDRFLNDLSNLREGLDEAKKGRHSDFSYTVTMFATGFLLICGMLTFGYFRLEDSIRKTDDNLKNLEILSSKIETKLDDLTQRVAPKRVSLTVSQ